MRAVYLVLSVVIALSLAGFSRAQRNQPAPAPRPTADAPSPRPTPAGMPLVTLGSDLGASVNRAFAEKAYSRINAIFWNGCLQGEITSHRFLSLNTVFDVSPKTSTEAWEAFRANAPYRIDARWYYSRFSKVIGYTYNFRDNADTDESETRVWSNTKFIDLADPDPYAAHTVHELSHQARAGGFVHYTVFGGSFPYDAGDAAERCLERLP